MSAAGLSVAASPFALPSAPGVKVANLILRPAGCELFVDGRRTHLTPHEFALLEAFVANAGSVLAKETLKQLAWGRLLVHRRDRLVDVYVRKLRAKLGAAAPGWVYIHTHERQGYRFEAKLREEEPV